MSTIGRLPSGCYHTDLWAVTFCDPRDTVPPTQQGKKPAPEKRKAVLAARLGGRQEETGPESPPAFQSPYFGVQHNQFFFH